MQDEKNNSNQPVILNLNPVNDNISQFIQLQTGILSESEIYVPSDSILPVGTRIKIEYRLRSFGQKENVKIIDAMGEVIGAEVDSEKGRRGVRAKFLKLSPTSQVLIQKLLEKMKTARPQSGEKKMSMAPQSDTIESKEKVDELSRMVEPKVKIEEPSVEIREPKITIAEPKIEISEPSIERQHDISAKKEETVAASTTPSTLAEIIAKEVEKPKSGETRSPDNKQSQYVFEYLPPGQPLEENTGIVKIREIVRSTDVSSVKKTSQIWVAILIPCIIVGGIIGFFFLFPQYAPRIFVRSQDISSVITRRDLTPENIHAPVQAVVVKEESGEKRRPDEREEAKKAEEGVEEISRKEEKKVEEVQREAVAEPEIQPIISKEEVKSPKKEEGVKIITKSRIKKEEEKRVKVLEEKDKKMQEEKSEKAKVESEKAKTKTEAAPAEPGKIIIQISPTDADLTVFIDGVQVGTMPTVAKQLPAGVHNIKVVADGYNEETRKIELGEGETKTIKINLKAK